MPNISVIVPVYKVEQYLSRCVDSILTQTYSDFELILVDDGSPDKCGVMCDAYAKQDDRVHVIHKPNGGLSDARNVGIDWAFANSDSQWLTFIDSDDWVLPVYLEWLLEAALKNHVSIAIGGFEKTKGDTNTPLKITKSLKVIKPEECWVHDHITATIACGKLYQKECFRDFRYPVGKLHEDEFITYRVLFSQSRLAVLDAPLYQYFQNPEGITGGSWNPRHMDAVEAVEEQIRFFKANNYKAAMAKQVVTLRWIINNYMTEIEGIGEYSAYYRTLQQKLKSLLICYRKAFPFQEYVWTYNRAFPRLMKWYWRSKSLVRRIHSNQKNDNETNN